MKYLRLIAIPVFFFLLTVLISSCKILHSPRLKSDEKFKGVKQFQAYTDSSSEIESYIIIHGIGEQKDNYSRKMIKRLSELSYGKNNVHYKFYRWNRGEFESRGTTINSEEFAISNGQPEVDLIRVVSSPKDPSKVKRDSLFPMTSVFYTINWSVAVHNERRTLEAEEFDTFQPFYFGLNKALKKRVMVRRVADAFNGSEDSLVNQVYKRFLNTIQDSKYPISKRVNLISGSFGSQLFLGCLSRYKYDVNNRESEIKPNDTLSNNQTIYNSIFRDNDFVLNMYMLTNQTNLMDKNINSWFKVNGDLKDSNRLDIEKVQITAMRNPNDILSYYLPEYAADSFFESDTKVNVTNAYYFNWPIRNDIASAHTAVFKLRKLSRVIWFGDASGWVKVKQ